MTAWEETPFWMIDGEPTERSSRCSPGSQMGKYESKGPRYFC